MINLKITGKKKCLRGSKSMLTNDTVLVSIKACVCKLRPFVSRIYFLELLFGIMFSSEVDKPTKFGKVMFVHLPSRLSSSKGRKQISRVDICIHSSLLFTELAGVTSTCTVPG